jgi:hypothetical protein
MTCHTTIIINMPTMMILLKPSDCKMLNVMNMYVIPVNYYTIYCPTDLVWHEN